MAAQRGLAVFGMKSMGGSGEMISHGALTPTEALTFAMSLPGVSTTISGMDSMGVLDQNLEILRNFKPLSEEQINALRFYAKEFDDGRYELFKSTVKYDGDLGRQQHDFPSAAELPPSKSGVYAGNVAIEFLHFWRGVDLQGVSDTQNVSLCIRARLLVVP